MRSELAYRRAGWAGAMVKSEWSLQGVETECGGRGAEADAVGGFTTVFRHPPFTRRGGPTGLHLIPDAVLQDQTPTPLVHWANGATSPLPRYGGAAHALRAGSMNGPN